MVKYIVGILMSALLVIGFHLDSNAKQQKLQLETVAPSEDVQVCSLSNCNVSTASTNLFNENCHAIGANKSGYEISDGILTDFSSFRSATAPSKTVKYHATTTRKMFHLADTQLPENKWQGFSPDTNYIKYSNKYYVYTLGHILI